MVFAASLLSPNVGLVIWLTVVFLALLLILRKYAWGPITSALSEREETIATSMNRAEEALAESKRLQESNKQARREAEQEARKLIQEAKEDADRHREQAIQRTREELAVLQEQAQEEIERDKERAQQKLYAEMVDLMVGMVEKVLPKTLDASQQRALVTRFTDELGINGSTQPSSYKA